jgi:hypothetical protein
MSIPKTETSVPQFFATLLNETQVKTCFDRFPKLDPHSPNYERFQHARNVVLDQAWHDYLHTFTSFSTGRYVIINRSESLFSWEPILDQYGDLVKKVDYVNERLPGFQNIIPISNIRLNSLIAQKIEHEPIKENR